MWNTVGLYPLSLSLLLMLSPAAAQEYRLEKIDSAPSTEDVSAEILQEIADAGYRVVGESGRTVMELWLRKDLQIDPDFEATPVRLYPFTPGQLVGLAHFPRRGSSFRDQQVSRGWYTLRFALQPVDGNHVGTSPTRDFLLLVSASDDQAPADWESEPLEQASAEAAGSAHPAMLCLQRHGAGGDGTLRHDEATDWWVANLVAEVSAGGDAKQLPIDLVVVGHATE